MKYRNPILRGFNPDPSICRVGRDYYLVTSTFEFFPGIPVYHSTDLVNWTQIANVIDRPAQLPFQHTPVGRGIWAPTIRFHQGRFYVTAKMMEFGNFIVSAEHPAGPWSDPVPVDMAGIDPSLLFDGGRAYYCTNMRGADNREAISLAEVDADTGHLLSDVRQIWHGVAEDRPQYLESPHIYHIGGWYYLMAAEGGTGYEHMITMARSRDIWGPYEDAPHNPLLTNRNHPGDSVACSGHGDLVEDADGSWWCVHLATRPDDLWYSHLGRETFLLPVSWREEWPSIADGKSALCCEGPLVSPQQPRPVWTADLSRQELCWLHLREPVEANYRFTPDALMLTPSTVALADPDGSPTLLAVRQPDVDCTAEAELSFVPAQDGDEAGLTVFISCSGHYRFGVTRRNGQRMLLVEKSGDGFPPLSIPAEGGRIKLRIKAEKSKYTLSFALEGGVFHQAGVIPVLTRADAGKCFTGTLIGLYAQCTADTAAICEVHSFRI